jgi:hypothetical protein
VVVRRHRQVALLAGGVGDEAVQPQLDLLVEDVGRDVAVQAGDVGDAPRAREALVGVQQPGQLALGQGVANRQARRGQRRLGVAQPRLLQARQANGCSRRARASPSPSM